LKIFNFYNHTIENYYSKLKNKENIINNFRNDIEELDNNNLFISKSISFSDSETFDKQISHDDLDNDCFNRIMTPDFKR
jgi:hypothetical protein